MLNKIEYNSPVVLNFTFISTALMVLSTIGMAWPQTLFSLPGSFNPANPVNYFRLVSHIFGHASWTHLMGNFSLILLLGPILEEKYGGRKLSIMIFVTALVTGLFHSILFSQGLLGASGVVFMMIILSSFANYQGGKIPLTFILVSLLFLGKEFTDMFKADNISQFAHIIGGVAGAVFGFSTSKEKA